MRKSWFSVVLVLGCLVAVAPAAQAGGFYVGGSLGQTSADLGFSSFEDPSGSTSISVDDSDTGFKVFGGFNFIKYFAVEAAWVDVAGVSVNMSDPTFDASMTAEANGLSFEAMGILPVGKGFELFADYGFYMWDGTSTIAMTGFPTISGSDDGSDPTYGIGAGWDFKGPGEVRLEWENYDISDLDIDMYSVGFSFSF